MASNLSYEDQLLEERDTAVSELETSYDTKIEDGKTHYSNLQDAVQQQADKQAEIQQANTDFAIETIEQHKAQTEKDYIKERSAAYADWKKQSNPYGAEAEKMASYGLEGTGYSESSQVAMYNDYQKRLTATREALDQAKLVYDNNIKEAILQNNAALAEIYANAYVSQMQLALEGFNYQNALLSELESKKAAINSSYLSALQQFQEQNTPENETNSVIIDDEQEGEKTTGVSPSNSLGLLGNIRPGSIALSQALSRAIERSRFEGTTYESAIAHIKKYGGSSSGLMTRREWQQTYASYKRTGIGSAEVKNYSSYETYLKDYVNYAINQ